MNISKMNREQLKFLLEINNNTLESLRIELQNWRNAMIHEMTEEGFAQAWEEVQAQNQLRVNEIVKENSEIYKKLQA